MKYLCLVYSEPNDLGPQTESEAQDLVEEHLDYDEILRQSGHLLLQRPFNPWRPQPRYESGMESYPSRMVLLQRRRSIWAGLS